MSQLDNDIIAFRDNMGKVAQFTNGAENADVQTANGPIPTLAKIAKTSRDLIAKLGQTGGSGGLRVDAIVPYSDTEKTNALTNLGLEKVNNTADLDKPISEATNQALNKLSTSIKGKEDTANKNRPSGYAGLSGLRLIVRNLADTFNGYFANNSTDERIWTLPDKSGTVALTSDITGINTGTNTGDETQATILAKLNLTSIAGVNTGDETATTIKTKLNVTKVEDVANKATSFSVVDNNLYPTTQAVKFYVDNLTVGVLRDCGNHDASTNLWPSNTGTGTAGAIQKGNFWYVSVPGRLGGVAVNVGDSFRALADNPGQDSSKWGVLESNLGYVPYNATNPAGYISGITGGMVTSALGFNPLNVNAVDGNNGVPGMTGFAINLKNNVGTVVSHLSNANTVARNYTLPDSDGVLALLSDIAAAQNSASLTLQGDVTGGGVGTVNTTIAANSVTLAKMAQVTTGVLLGRSSAGTGNVEVLGISQAKTLLGIDQVNNTSDVNKPVSTAQQSALNAKENIANKATNFTTINDALYPTIQATKTYVDNGVINAKAYADSLVVGLIDDRGSYNASSNTFPTTGGSGAGGAILKGDLWYVSAAGTLGGSAVVIGDSFRALVDNPGQTAASWSILEGNLGYVPYNSSNPAGYISGITGTMVINALGFSPVSSLDKDASGGFVGKNAQKVNLKNNAGTLTSTLENSNTAARAYVMPDKSGTVAMTSDITGINTGTNTGDETQATILSKLGASAVTGSNTGDETATTIKSKLGYTPLNKAGDVLGGPINYAPKSSIASSTIVDLTSIGSNICDITGSSTITSITLSDGQVRIVRFTATLTLTNSASLLLPTNFNIVTAVGDCAVFVGRGSGVTQCMIYTPISGMPVFGNSREKVRAITANTATTTIDLNNGDGASIFKVTIAANTTITFTNPPPSPNGEVFNFTLITINDSAAGRAMGFGNTIQWAGAITPPRTTAANAKDVWAFYVDGSVYAGSLAIEDQR